MAKLSMRIAKELGGRDRTDQLPEREHCDFSCSERMCLFLDRIGVPRDQKWRTLILYMRSLEDYDVLDVEQKAEIQDLVLKLIKEEEYSDQNFQEALSHQKKVLLRPFEQKVMAAMEDTAKTIQEFKATLQARKGNVEDLAQLTLDTINDAENPEMAAAKIKEAFNDVVAFMEEDVAELDERSRTDALTGLANRLSFNEHLEQTIAASLESGLPLSLVLVDIDHFKRVNDTYGHRIGDQALVAVARLIMEFGEEIAEEIAGSFFAARFGGEEFAIIFEGLDQVTASHLTEIVRKKVERYDFAIRDVDGHIVDNDRLQISAGVAELEPETADNPEDRLIEAADKALYRAKSTGRNRVCQAGSIL